MLIPGTKLINEQTWGMLPLELSVSTADQFAVLLTNPDAQLIILMIAYPYTTTLQRTVAGLPAPTTQMPWPGDPSFDIDGGERSVYLSDQGFATKANDAPPHEYFDGRLQPALDWSLSLFDGAEPTGEGRAAIGEIGIMNHDGDLDHLVNDAWDGREVRMLAGTKDLRVHQFGEVLRGTVDQVRWSENRISLRLRDPGAVFNLPLSRGRYDGTGGAGGDADLAGALKPYCAGRCRNVSPILVSAVDLLYQVHDGKVSAIDAVRDKGVALTNAGDYSTVALLLAATTGIGADIEPGEFATCLAEGCFRLGGDPDGTITSDVRGDAGDAGGAGYVNDTANIVRRIVTSRIGLFALQDPAQIDGASFNLLKAAQPAEAGVYVRTDEINVREVIGPLLAGIGGYWFFTRRGLLGVGRLQAPSSPVRTITNADIVSIERIELPQPVWQRRVTYKRSWTVQRDDDLAASVSDADRQLYGNEFRFETAANSVTRGKHRYARAVDTFGFFDSSADADAEAERLNTLHSADRARYRIVIKRALFRLYPGDAVRVQYPRYGLDAGVDFIIAAMQEVAAGDHTVLELWGGASSDG